MGKLSSNDVKHVVKLAKLVLTSSEIRKFQGQLSKVISYIDELSEVDTKNVGLTSQTTGLSNVFRKDEIKSDNCLFPREALSGSSKKHNGYFVVNAILEKDTVS